MCLIVKTDMNTIPSRGLFVSQDLTGSNEGINDLAVKNGKVTAVGWYTPSTTRWAVARYNANGTLDATCDGNGLKGIYFSGDYSVATQVRWDSSRITIAGWAREPGGSGYDFAAAVLFGNDCAFDNSFDSNGLRVVDVTDQDDVSALITDSFIYMGGRY
jgi:hypothetical protein